LTHLSAFANAFKAADPVDVAIGLDGSFTVQAAVAGLREIFAGVDTPIDQTLNVRVDVVGDRAAWRDAGTRNVRLPGAQRKELSELTEVTGVAQVRALLAWTPA
jgi:hypothetical protein